ncbi:MAG: acetyl ornithine aminotransferase family protein [Deltaproteobacteria bacterium]|nr:acetyl ornithine aminotransferase family protein [Deltaproteobacteria bacterium]
MNVPSIRTEVPGPRAREILDKDNKYISQSYTRVYPLVVKRGKGVVIEDVDGNHYLDFTSGIAVCNTGHCHPEVVRAIKQQVDRFIHMSGTDFYYAAQSCLAAKLSRLYPGGGDHRVFFGNSGAEAVEAAMKLARYHTKRPRFMAFLGSFHGRTMGALSLTASKTVHERGFSPLVPGVTHIPYPYCYRCPYHMEPAACNLHCVDWIEEDLFRRSLPPEEVAAVFVEPIQGEGGYVVPPEGFHTKLFQLTRKFGILYVADEVQTGMGRTGRMFASEHFGVVPDIMALAKGLASGLPLGAMVAEAGIMDWVPGSHASTFGGNPISCEASLATIALLEGGMMQKADRMGAYLKENLRKLMDRYVLIGDVRGLGLMVGAEIVKDRVRRTKDPLRRDEIIQRCFRKGLLLLGCGENSIRFIPPLIVNRSHIDTALTILEEVLRELTPMGE